MAKHSRRKLREELRMITTTITNGHQCNHYRWVINDHTTVCMACDALLRREYPILLLFKSIEVIGGMSYAQEQYIENLGTTKFLNKVKHDTNRLHKHLNILCGYCGTLCITSYSNTMTSNYVRNKLNIEWPCGHCGRTILAKPESLSKWLKQNNLEIKEPI